MTKLSKTTSFADQSASIIMLNVKPKQNIILDLDSSHYNETLRPMIKCLWFSPLVQAFTIAESVPLVHLSKAYLSANYSQSKGVIHFEVASHNTSISKSRFCRILGLASFEGLVDLKSISTSTLIDMFYQIGYIGDISLFSKFRKPLLPPIGMGCSLFSSTASQKDL